MTTLAERTTTIATGIYPASPRRQPVDALPTAEQLLRQRDDLPAGHPHRAQLRARVIEGNLLMANRLARRYAGRGELFDDLAQVAALALIKAVDGYDPSRQVAFTSYAIPTILGALKRHFRDTTWGMRVPRSIQVLAHDITAAISDLTHQRGRPPTRTELANHLHVDLDDLRIAIGARHAYQPESLNAPHPGTDNTDLINVLGGPDPRYAHIDDHLTLQPLFAALPQREQRILTMRFFDHMTQTQIATQIGLSQMHVSRLLKQSLARLRAAMPA